MVIVVLGDQEPWIYPGLFVYYKKELWQRLRKLVPGGTQVLRYHARVYMLRQRQVS